MRTLLKISRLIDSINEGIGRLTYWLVLVMILISTWNVAGRYIGRWLGEKLTSNGLLETQWYLFDIIFLLGAAYGLKHNEHVRVDLFYKDFNRRKKALINIIGTVLFLIPFCLMVIFYSWEWTLNSWSIWEMSSDPDGLPRYPIKSMIIIGLILLLLQGISETIKNWAILQEED